jgi:hypothetical protein
VASIEAYELLALSVALLAVVLLAAFHFLRSYRLRRLQELKDDGKSPQRTSDRAFNRLALARREADVLAAQGGDVDRARQLIDLASRSLDARQFDRAYDLAQSAHETLVKARRDPHPLPSAAAVPAHTAVGGPATDPRPAAPAVAKGRAEAQFQLRLFEQDLAAAAKGSPGGADAGGARELYVQAHAAFARADYPEAFRLSLRGRRQVGGHIEALGPPTTVPAPGRRAPGGPEVDPVRSAEEVAALERCPLCGHPTVASDAYCRGCGAARTPTACPSCGAPRTPIDTFCGRCGERYAATGS